jgi:tetratricopeptide (TPR) repeat protein
MQRQAIRQLADEAQKNPDLIGRLTPQMVVVISKWLTTEEKAKWLRKTQVLHPADFWINFELAGALQASKGQGQEAIGYYRAALAVRPDNIAVLNNLGSALRNQKDLPAAIEAYQRALAIDPQFAIAWNNLGSALRNQKDLPAAIDAHRKALAIDPQYAKAWTGLGTVLRDQKDLPAAIDAHKKALAIDPQLAIAWNNLGYALWGQNDLPAATSAYQKALAIDPQFAWAWNGLGGVLYDQHVLPAARDAFKKALAIDPQYAHAWDGLGNVFHDQKDLPAAIDAHKKALAIDPEFIEASSNLGLDYQSFANEHRRDRRLDEAEKYFVQALQLHKDLIAKFPNQAVYQRNCAAALNDLALTKLDQKLLVEARELLKQALSYQEAALKLNPTVRSSREYLGRHYGNLGSVLLRLGERAEAENIAAELARKFPQQGANLYTAASVMAGCVPLAEKDAALSEEKRRELASSCADRSMDLLRQAVKHGWSNVQNLEQDTNFAPLAAREDFKNIVAELKAKRQK